MPTTKRPSKKRAVADFLVGGVNSPVRNFRAVNDAPILVKRAAGPWLFDDRNRRYVDFIMGWGALLLGHNPPVVVEGLLQALKRGELFGLTHANENRLARSIVNWVPSVEQVRFTVSGSEACMTAVRLARAYTGRSTVLAFDGCYHGHGDSLMIGSAGVPSNWASSLVRAPLNNLKEVERLVLQHAADLACVIVEPVAANIGVIPPARGFLEALRTLTRKVGALLVFDEVVTGFRLGNGSAQKVYGTAADLTAFGKVIGGGMPIGAVGGPRGIMERLSPCGDVYHGGTFAGHPLSMAAGVAALEELQKNPPYDRLRSLADQLSDGIKTQAEKAGVAVQVNCVGSMLTVFFTQKPVVDAASARATSRKRFAHWARALRAAGILIPPSPFEALFLSAAHSEKHVAQFLESSASAFRGLRRVAA